jgi:ATP-dependent RNA helicase DDX51/DBP6
MDQESAGKNAEAGPSRLPESNPETEQEKAVKKKKKAAKEDSEDEEVDVAAERERRKREKREKRAARDKTEKRKLKEEKRKKEAEKGKSKVVDDEAPMPVDPTKPLPTEIPAEDSSEDEAVSGDEPGADDKISIDGEEEENTARKSSPVPLHAFPLPTPAPAPDPALLSRQGLPANLENATFVDQNLSLPVGQLEVQYEEGPEKGLGDMEERLKSIGVEEFFAGKFEYLVPEFSKS